LFEEFDKEVPANDEEDDYERSSSSEDEEESEDEDLEETDFNDDDGEEERYKKFQVKMFYCDICHIKTLLKSNLEAHMVSHLPVKSYITKNPDFSRLMKQKTQKPFVCPCGKDFKYRSQFVDHTNRVHKNIRDYSCQFCGKNYYTRRELSVHIKRTHMKGKNLSV
jgi:Zinc finger, C2H2 type